MITFRQTNQNHAKDTSIEWIAAQVLSRYLIDGATLQEIEEDLFESNELKGWLSKCLLNFYDVDTSKKANNRGALRDFSVSQVIEILSNSTSSAELAIARTLKLLAPN